VPSTLFEKQIGKQGWFKGTIIFYLNILIPQNFDLGAPVWDCSSENVIFACHHAHMLMIWQMVIIYLSYLNGW